MSIQLAILGDVPLCECGCGGPAPIAAQTDTGRGYVKGQPTRFICGHNQRQPPGPRTCTKCGEVKPLTEFSRRGRGVYMDGTPRVLSQCKVCCSADRTRGRSREWSLKKTYGLTSEEYDAMLAAQGGVCALCGNASTHGKQLCVDHCHKTSKIRALLCDVCNRGLGYFKDDPEALRGAADYLEQHRAA